jgi:hypothetical protein
MELAMIRVEECRWFAQRCLQWADNAKHEEIRSVYMEMADEWARRAGDLSDFRGDRDRLHVDPRLGTENWR